MHSYRDSIRDRNGHHIVTLAAILYPGLTVVYEPGLAALQAQPADPQPLRSTLRASIRDAMAATRARRDGPNYTDTVTVVGSDVVDFDRA